MIQGVSGSPAAIPPEEQPALDAGQVDAEEPLPMPKISTVRVHYPAGSHLLELRGERAPLGWEAGVALSSVDTDTWELVLGELTAPLALTPTLDGQRALGPNYVVHPGEVLDIYPHFSKEQGTISLFDDAFESQALGNTRAIRMYLPPSYDENTAARYPVIYMHDGQTIFEGDLLPIDGTAELAFGTWKAEKVMDEAIKWGVLPEAIIIGIDVIITPSLDPNELTKVRLQELTPTRDDDNMINVEGSGQGPNYLRMIYEELKPQVDARLRTRPEPEHTVIGGSSLGGLISLWAGIYHSDIFGKVFGMSNSTFWDDELLAERVRSEGGDVLPNVKVYVDTSDYEAGPSYVEESAEVLAQHQRLFRAYRDAGYVNGATLMTLVAPHAQSEEIEHNGKYWNRRLSAALAFLLGPGR